MATFATVYICCCDSHHNHNYNLLSYIQLNLQLYRASDIPLSDKVQSSPTHDTFENEDTYEEVDVPRPVKGSFDCSQCPAYTSVLGEVNVEIDDIYEN